MNDADFILKWTEDLKAEIETLKYQEDDIRKDYFGLTYDAAAFYYKCFMLLPFSNFINENQTDFKKQIDNYKNHIDRISNIAKYPALTESYLNSLNRSMLIDAWSVFELCVTTFCNGICSKQELEKLLEYHYKEILNEIKEVKLTDLEDVKIRKLTIKEHLTHVPISRKTDFLFKKAKGYKRDEKQDKEFLGFFGKFRNTLHTNFIYYGKNYEYDFGKIHFVFKNEKIVKWDVPPEFSPRLYFNLIGELKDIWKELIETIEYPKFIEYPDNE